MRFKVLGLMAVLVLVAGCSTAPKEAASASGAGASSSGMNNTSQASSSAASKSSAATQDQLLVDVGDTVHFDFDKYNLKPEASKILDGQAAWLKKHPGTKIIVEGHCDERGTREYNLALGERRANSVKSYLVALGVSSSRITVISYGKERPIALGSNEKAWAQNRRAVTKIVPVGS